MTMIINLKYRRQQYPGKGSCKDSCLFIAFIQIIKIIQGGLKNLKDIKMYERERVSYNLALKRQPLITVWGILVLFFFFFSPNFKVYLGIMEKSWFPETLKSLWKYPDSLFGICLKPPIKSGLPQTEHSKYIKRILNLLFRLITTIAKVLYCTIFLINKVGFRFMMGKTGLILKLGNH